MEGENGYIKADVKIDGNVSKTNGSSSNNNNAKKTKNTKRKKRPNFTEYYDLLEVPYDVPQDELKKAYRKMALKLHPDKQGGDQEQFNRMKHAYDILKDPKKRKTYDDYGPEFLKIMEGEAGMDEYFAAVLAQSFYARLLAVSVIVFIIGVTMLFPILLSVKWDSVTYSNQKYPFSWVAVFIPLWIMHIFHVLGAIYSVATMKLGKEYVGDPDAVNEFNKLKLYAKIYVATVTISFTLLSIGEAFIAITLDSPVAALYSWFIVLIPFMLVCFIIFVYNIISAQHDYELKKKEATAAYDVPDFGSFVFQRILWATIWFIQLFAIADRANKDFFYPPPQGSPKPYSWYVAFLPMYLGCIINIAYQTYEAGRVVARKGDRSDTWCHVLECGEERLPMLACINSTVYSLIWLVGLFIACDKLDNPTSVSAWAIWSILFIILSCIFVCTCRILCISKPRPPGHDEQHEQAGNEEPSVPMDIPIVGIKKVAGRYSQENYYLLKDIEIDIVEEAYVDIPSPTKEKPSAISTTETHVQPKETDKQVEKDSEKQKETKIDNQSKDEEAVALV